jgi:hypothetical protein
MLTVSIRQSEPAVKEIDGLLYFRKLFADTKTLLA